MISFFNTAQSPWVYVAHCSRVMKQKNELSYLWKCLKTNYSIENNFDTNKFNANYILAKLIESLFFLVLIFFFFVEREEKIARAIGQVNNERTHRNNTLIFSLFLYGIAKDNENNR